MNGSPPIAVCIPARNEAERLPVVLAALAEQTIPALVVISLNNTDDASYDATEAARRAFPNLAIVCDNVHFAPHEAHAGSARRRVMDFAANRIGASGILITTDADARPPPHWVAANIEALNRGLDIVGGQIRSDEREAIAPRLRAIMAKTADYWSEVRAIEDAIDPIAWDPPPRHGDHTGASLALSVATYRQSGGVPIIPVGEDRALVEKVCGQGGRLGHPQDVWTRVSARTRGRAESGMAAEMARLSESSSVALPHFDHWRARAQWRRDIRDRFGFAEVAVRERELPPMPCDMVLTIDDTLAA